MSKIFVLALVLFVVRVPAPGWSMTWYVDGSVAESGDGTSWETAFRKIQEGIDAAWYGETVMVAQGTYVENITFRGINITLTGTDPTDPDVVANTIIDGNQAGSVVTFDGTEDESCVLSGFTIRNGNAEYGGGILGGEHARHSQASIQNNRITDNSANQGGGLAYCNGTVQNNTITANSAENYGGGVVWCDGRIQNNEITDNSASNGGGLAECGGTIHNNTITGNSAENYGGGLSGCGGTIHNNAITGNSAERYGGGLYVCRGVVRNNVISGNSATVEGGGLHGCGGPILNNLVVANYAHQSGGGLSRCSGVLQHNTICHNSTGWSGGGLCFCPGTIRNCVIWGNRAETGAQLADSTIPTYSCISAWTGGGEGNISPKYGPGFVDPDGPDDDPSTHEDNDYHLKPDSPCRDSGINFYWFVWPQQDLDGLCRLAGETVDMGCYEYGSSPDADGDLLSDTQEEAARTDSSLEDTDADGLRDGLEILRGTDPLHPDMSPRTVHVPSQVATIQECLCLACEGDEIIVAPGNYRVNLQFCGANVVLTGSDPNESRVVASTILDGGGASGPVVWLLGTETDASILTGFTIRNGAGLGGGIRGSMPPFGDSGATIARNVITANHAYAGGGLYGCAGTIDSNMICGNSATMSGGGGGLSHCSGSIQNNVICGNRTSSAWPGGGLAYCDGIIRNNTICHNGAAYGGGLYGCDGEIQNNVICWNSGSAWGGGVCDCDGVIHHCAIWANVAPEGPQTYLCDGEIHSLIIEDPRLVDPDGPDDDAEAWEDNDYHLAAGSPCIDKGDNEDWMWWAVDLDGNERIIDGDEDGSDVVDMGAYEYRFVMRIVEVVASSGGAIELQWSSRPGQSYLVWRCQDLLAGDWGPVATVPSGGTTTTWSDPMPSVAKSFYRIGLD
jgi:hypothetical protein